MSSSPALSTIAIAASFELPIQYDVRHREVGASIIEDLELVSVYDNVIRPATSLGMNALSQLVKYYTPDVDFLRNTQSLVAAASLDPIRVSATDEALASWNEIKYGEGFMYKYGYFEHPMVAFLNTNSQFQQIWGCNNLASPIITILTPLFVILIPLVFIFMRRLPLSHYYDVLCKLFSQHMVVKRLIKIQENPEDTTNLIYFVLSVGFYVFTIYNNAQSLHKFHANLLDIHAHISTLGEFLRGTANKMRRFSEALDKTTASAYAAFNRVLKERAEYIETEIIARCAAISPFSYTNFRKLGEFGEIYTFFYQLYFNTKMAQHINYAFGFNGYVDAMEGISLNNELSAIEFAGGAPKFKDMYYGGGSEVVAVRNDYDHSNMVLTGVNASGKTTFLKSILVNVLLTQQFGVGCYGAGSRMEPYDNIHCYLNIIDTNDRFSLFQKECDKCKHILDEIKRRPDEKHLCVFDELFSGTNPVEATSCSYSFLKYLSKNERITFALTTHFTKLAKKIKRTNPLIQNMKMVSRIDDDGLTHTYKIKKGINVIKGGVEILKQLDFPNEITRME